MTDDFCGLKIHRYTHDRDCLVHLSRHGSEIVKKLISQSNTVSVGTAHRSSKLIDIVATRSFLAADRSLINVSSTSIF